MRKSHPKPRSDEDFEILCLKGKAIPAFGQLIRKGLFRLADST